MTAGTQQGFFSKGEEW